MAANSPAPILPSHASDGAWRHCWMRGWIGRRTLIGIVLGLWCAGLVAGVTALWNYSATPGSAGSVPQWWPANGLVQPKPGRATLVMLAHPRCPCTGASLAELANLMARGDADASVLFLRPEGAEPGWEKTELWETAVAIPNVRAVADVDGMATQAFGAETSGHVLFYDATGVLRFSGGITSTRGHRGPSAGGETILALLRGAEARLDRSLTFGCPLQSKEPQP
jgi:hypothetical protein